MEVGKLVRKLLELCRQEKTGMQATRITAGRKKEDGFKIYFEGRSGRTN